MIPKNVQMPNPNPKYKPPGVPGGGRGGNMMDKKDLAELTPEEKEKPVTWGEFVEVVKMIGEEAIKLTERSDTEKNALDDVVEMIIDSMNTRFVFLLQLMCNAHRWDCSEMLHAYEYFRRQMENKEEP